MSEPREITLGDRTFAVPMLPIRHNRIVYPLCRDLSMIREGEAPEETFFARVITAGGGVELVRDDEWPKLEDIAFHAACAAEKDLTREAFDDLPITPIDLLTAFFLIRYQTGVWREGEVAAEPTAEHGAGEAEGAISPQT